MFSNWCNIRAWIQFTLSRYVTDSVIKIVAFPTTDPPSFSATQEYVPDPDLHKNHINFCF